MPCQAATTTRRIVLRHDLFQLAVLQAKIVHLVDELRVFHVVLVGADQVVDRVELIKLARLLEKKQSHKGAQQNIQDDQENPPSKRQYNIVK